MDALLLIDVQRGFHDPVWGEPSHPAAPARIAQLLERFRERGRPVIHVHHHSRETGSPLRPDQPGVEPMPEAMPREGEEIFIKHVNSAFIGTALEARLRERGIRELVLAGYTADHCVSTSARMAANLGFAVTIVADATPAFRRRGHDGRWFPAELVHSVHMASLHNEFARVIPASALI